MRIDGNKLKQARMAAGITEFELSQAAKMKQEQVTNLETYGGTVRKEAAERLALALNVLPGDLELKKAKEIAEAPAEACTEKEQMPIGGVSPIPEPVKVADEPAPKQRNQFIRFYRKNFPDQEPAEILIRADMLTAVSKDMKYPKIWISYVARTGIADSSEVFSTEKERDARWDEIMQAMLRAGSEVL